jgi:hypothetical protein
MNSNVLQTTDNKASETMSDKVPVARSIIKIAKFVSLGALALVVILSVAPFASKAHFARKYSGSNQWELEIDKDGVKVYSLKSPDSPLNKFKAVTRIKTTLSRAVASMLDPDLENCVDWNELCVIVQSVEPWNPQGQYLINYYRSNNPPPLPPRDQVLKIQVTQDAKSKAVLIEVTALPDRLPKNDCCFRVTHMRNSWRYTPVENGEIEIEHQQDADRGYPYDKVNQRTPDNLYRTFRRLPELLNKEKYHHASFDFIKN